MNRCGVCPVEYLKDCKIDIIRGSNRVLIVGESPKGTLDDSLKSITFKRLAEELKNIGIILNECSLTELCKCELSERKYFEKVAKNCVVFLDRQIVEIKPELIITIGVTTKNIISSFYGQLFEIGKINMIYNIKYLPLYHPSPANPTGHKKNLNIIKHLKF